MQIAITKKLADALGLDLPEAKDTDPMCCWIANWTNVWAHPGPSKDEISGGNFRGEKERLEKGRSNDDDGHQKHLARFILPSRYG